MHAWDCGTPEQFPGWHRAVEYIPRANRILAEVFPSLLRIVRSSPMEVIHVVSDARPYFERYPGWRRMQDIAGEAPEAPEQITADPGLERLREFRNDHVFVGPGNREDVQRGFAAMRDFPPQVRPEGEELIAATSHQLFAVCKERSISHLVYTGFAINWCLLLSPGGMADLSRRGVMCSAIRQAVTAVENRETARQELCKDIALWRVALAFGFVYDVDDFTEALGRIPPEKDTP